MNWLALLNTIAKNGLVVYLVSHGVGLPADSKVEPRQLAEALYYASVGWILSRISWATAVVEFLTRAPRP